MLQAFGFFIWPFALLKHQTASTIKQFFSSIGGSFEHPHLVLKAQTPPRVVYGGLGSTYASIAQKGTASTPDVGRAAGGAITSPAETDATWACYPADNLFFLIPFSFNHPYPRWHPYSGKGLRRLLTLGAVLQLGAQNLHSPSPFPPPHGRVIPPRVVFV